MTCRKCGTEISDKALVCYKCGTATTEPVYAPPASGGRRSSTSMLIVSIVALVLMAVAATFISRAAPDATSRSVTWVVAGVAVVIVILRAYARRR